MTAVLFTEYNAEASARLCRMVLPGGSTILRHQIYLLKNLEVEHIIIPQALASFECELSAAGFKVQLFNLPAIIDINVLQTNSEFRQLLSGLSEDILVIDINTVIQESILQRLCKSQRSRVATVVTDEQSKTALNRIVAAFDGVSLTMVSANSGSNDFLEVDGKILPFYFLRAVDLGDDLEMEEEIGENNGEENGESTDADSVDTENNVEIRDSFLPVFALNCPQCVFCRLDEQKSAEEMNDFVRRLRMVNQRVWTGVGAVIRFPQLVSSLACNTPALVYEAGSKKTTVHNIWINSGYFKDHLQVGADFSVDVSAARLAALGCDCVVYSGSECIQRIGKALAIKLAELSDRPISHIAVPTLNAVKGAESDRVCISGKLLLNPWLIPDAVIFGTSEEHFTPMNDEIFWNGYYIEALCRAVNSMWAVCSDKGAVDYAEKSIKIVKKSLFRIGSDDFFEVAAKAIMYSTFAQNISGETAANGISAYLNKELGIEKPYAMLISTAATADLLYSNNQYSIDNRGRRVLANCLDEIGNLMGTETGQIASLLRELLYVLGWRPGHEQQPDCTQIVALLSKEQKSNTAIALDSNILQTSLIPLFKPDYSIYEVAQRQIDKIKSRGYDPRCMDDIVSYEGFKKAVFQRKSIYAKQLFQEALVKLCANVDSFCRENGLKYVLIGEAQLGAERDGQLLPITNKLEIAMPAVDIQKFAEAGRLAEDCCVEAAGENGMYYEGLRVYMNHTYWLRLHNIYALNESKEIYITVKPLYEAKGKGFDEKFRFKLANILQLILTHKQGIHHRKVGWKGELIFALCKFMPCKFLFKLRNSLFRNNSSGSYYICDSDQSYSECLIEKNKVFPVAEAELAGHSFFVPQQQFLFKEDDLTARLGAKQNNCFMPGTYLLSMGAENEKITLASPKQSVACMGVLSTIKKKFKTLLINVKNSIKKKFNAFKTWYQKIGKPKTKSWLRAQYVRCTGTLRGMGICIKPSSRLLKSYKNKYAGQRCFLVGNGPSLCAEDLDKLCDEVTIGCNFIHKIYPQTRWRPTYHFISDSSTVRTGSWDMVRHLDESRTTMFIREFAYKFMYVKPSKAVLVPYISVDKYKVHGNFLAYHYISHATVMSMMIEGAFYMGFKEIYLIGVDGTTASSKGGNFVNNYFTPEQREKLDKLKKKAIQNYDIHERRKAIQARQNMVYQMLRNYADSHGIKIYNATRGGALEVFERVDFDSIVG